MNSNTCYIITAFVDAPLNSLIHISEKDTVICADGGYLYAKDAGIVPDVLIGDFDSLKKEDFSSHIKTVTHPAEKDDTDTILALKYAISQDHKNVVIVGGIGGRIDHTLANLQAMAYVLGSDIQSLKLSMISKSNLVYILQNSSIEIEGVPNGYVSLLCHSDTCKGVYTRGLKWELEDAVLTNKFPLGVSNKLTKEKGHISVEDGTLFVMICND